MKSVVGPLLVAVVLALAGGAFWIAGQTERRLAEMHQQLALLQYADLSSEDEDGEATLGLSRRLPRIGEAMANDLRDERALAQYWRSEYAAVEPRRDSAGALTESDPHLLLVSGNAEFRAGQRATDRADMLRRLDRAAKTYGDVLKSISCTGGAAPSTRSGSDCETLRADASYNYELVVRQRDALARSRMTPAKMEASRNAQRLASDVTSDLPAGPTLHGYPGGPPKGTDMSQFKIVIPKRGEERKDNPEAGKGGAKVRKG
ncbi:MAG TPA: hypothetical protein VKH34_16905 [Vicinamibacterales bacterium]|nr:hypothetical protein [Vicinamibacterales bacterium]